MPLRYKYLNVNEFATLDHVWQVFRSWQHDYNQHQLHGSLGKLTPTEFAMKGQKNDPKAPKV